MAATAPPRTQVTAIQLRARASSGAVELDVLAREAGLHPDVVRRFVKLGLLEPAGRRGATRLFPRDAAARLARAARLRRDLGLDYSGAVLVSELLARIDDLQARLSRYEQYDDTAR